MKYISCKICAAVMESSANWRIVMEMRQHIKNEHPEEFAEILEDQDRYRKETDQIKEPLNFTDYLIFETLPKAAGRKEFGDKIVNIKL